MVGLTLVKKVARDIKYRRVDDLLGDGVVVDGIETAEREVSNLVNRSILGTVGLIPKDLKFVRGAIAKYGILDVTLSTLDFPTELEHETGLDLPRRLHLVPKPSDDKMAREIGADVLQSILRDIDSGKIFVRIFLETDVSDFSKLERLSFVLKELPANFFPREFIVKDVCVTNARDVWMFKHFYL